MTEGKLQRPKCPQCGKSYWNQAQGILDWVVENKHITVDQISAIENIEASIENKTAA